MTGRRIGVLVALGVAMVSGAVMLVPATARPDERPPSGPRGSGMGSVEVSMKEMGRALRKLRGSVEDASKKDENLAAIGEMQRGCVNAKNLGAPKGVLKEAADDASREKMTADYRTHLISLMRKLLDLEESVVAGKLDVAKTQVDEIFKMQKEGHEAMGMGDE